MFAVAAGELAGAADSGMESPVTGRAALRAVVFARDGNRCVWPRCGRQADELAHFHSIGMGGRDSADVPSNCAAMCTDHARVSDGVYGSGGKGQYRQAHLDLLGARFIDMPRDRIGWERAEALVDAVRRRGTL